MKLDAIVPLLNFANLIILTVPFLAGVAHILANEAGVTDLDVLLAAILHDTVEDTDTTLNEIEWNFGERVRGIVAEVTDDKSLPKQERKKLQVRTRY